jgi:hypothetical protein
MQIFLNNFVIEWICMSIAQNAASWLCSIAILNIRSYLSRSSVDKMAFISWGDAGPKTLPSVANWYFNIDGYIGSSVSWSRSFQHGGRQWTTNPICCYFETSEPIPRSTLWQHTKFHIAMTIIICLRIVKSKASMFCSSTCMFCLQILQYLQ